MIASCQARLAFEHPEIICHHLVTSISSAVDLQRLTPQVPDQHYQRIAAARLSGMTTKHSPVIPQCAFTVIELLITITLILVLAGLILATSGYVQTKVKRSRAEAEIAAITAALENYRADNGTYPTDTTNGTTNALDARTTFNPTAAQYSAASLFLYKELSGDPAGNRAPTDKSYFTFKPNMLLPKEQTQAVTAIADPFGVSYGYSTANQANPSKGYNPTFDLWSTAGGMAGADQAKWIKNW
jgi:type II secretory pathway pseudopilin PulG